MKKKKEEYNKEIELLEENTKKEKKVKEKKRYKEKKEKQKKKPKEKKVKDKNDVESEKTVKVKKKRKLNKLNILIFFSSFIAICVAVFVTLIGVGIIPIEKETGPIYYLLSEKVKVGDYVDYNAGAWEEDKEVPSRASAFTFGGYKKDTSRNDGVTCNYNEKENKGWRVFSVEDGVVTLIQSGISMCYYHGNGNVTNDRSVTILTNKDENNSFDYFLDDKFSDNVRALSKEDVDNFYGEDSSYKRIRDDLIKVDNPYWLATKNGSYYMWYVTEGGTVAADHVGSYGIRVLVTLKEDTKTLGKNKNDEWRLNEEVKKDE